ncbi:MAG: DUF2145 domain-containing protein [Betaproteobacteria bacterium]|nr:DUF2145 domain-containing protein [Betaproteobacteria bacterium]
MNLPSKIRRALCAALAVALLAGCCGLAFAGQNCEPRRPSLESIRRDLALAASVADQLDEMARRDGTRVVLIARAGQDLSQHSLRYSHLGFAYRDEAALNGRGAWRVVHKLNQCGSRQSTLYRQGLAEFFGDGLHLHEAGGVVLKPDMAARMAERLKDDRVLGALHEPRYNMLAYPWSGPYQQSNQWASETLAMLADPAVVSRESARNWLRAHDYRPTTLQIDPLKRLGARVATAHISFDDHPFGRRMAGQIDTVTVDSVFAWMERAGLGNAPLRLRTLPPDRVPRRSVTDT